MGIQFVHVGGYMKVLLINTCSKYVKQKAPLPLGLLSIATYLKENGHDVVIFDRAVEGGSLSKYMRLVQPDIVGLSIPGSMSLDDALKLSKKIKVKGVPVVWGGATASLIPDLVLQSGFVDYVIMGDGELVFLELVKALGAGFPVSGIDGLAYIENGTPVINDVKILADLADLPIIDFTFVDPKKYYFQNRNCKKMLHVYSSKGCSGSCTYCYNTGYAQRKWRARPSEYYISELKYLIENYQIDGVYFVDDLLSSSREYLQEFCENLIRNDLGIYWSCDMRADLCEKEDLKLMYDAGCRWIMFGIESGTPEGQKIIKKNLDLNKTKELMDYLDEIGIFTTVTFVTGFHYQTEKDLKATVKYMLELNAKVKIAGIYGPFPGSEMYRDLVRDKIIKPFNSFEDWSRNANMHTIGNNLSEVPPIELKVIVNYFLFSVFTNKYELDGEQKHFWVKRLVFQVWDMLKRKNLRSWMLIVLSAKEFLEIVYYALMFPRIRKKYGLKLIRKECASSTDHDENNQI